MSQKERDALKPCPFCGTSNIEAIEVRYEWSVVCHGCHIGTGHSPSKYRVIEDWNSRYDEKHATRKGYCERHPYIKIIDHSLICGAPQCCPKCCDEATAEIETTAQESVGLQEISDIQLDPVNTLLHQIRHYLKEGDHERAIELLEMEIGKIRKRADEEFIDMVNRATHPAPPEAPRRWSGGET